MPVYGSMRHDFTGRKIKKKVVHGDRFKKFEAPAFTPKVADAGPYRRDADVQYKSAELGAPSVCAAPEKKEYTGTLIKGIATMHKSNAVPVINQQEATDIANMRRGG
jgi:hypothetical protein